MDISAFLNPLFSAGNPVLPNTSVMGFALFVVWATVLGSGALLLADKLARPYRLGLALLVIVLTLVPGESSPAYWLGLSFQTPSLMSGLICLAWALGQLRQDTGQSAPVLVEQPKALIILSLLGVGLGWVLLLDTLAWFPVSIYAWGFSAAAVVLLVMLAALGWLLSGALGANLICLGVLALFVLTRLPTGNVWDALIDPWLWVALQAGWLVSAARRLRVGRRTTPATRV